MNKDMFINYESINSNLIPQNRAAINPFLNQVDADTPEYFWYYGDTVDLTFDLVGEVIIESTSRIITGVGVTPTLLPQDIVGVTKVYNITDEKLWLLESVQINEESGASTPTWNEIEYEFPTTGDICYINSSRYLRNKIIKIELFDSNHQEIVIKDINKWTSTTTEKPFAREFHIEDDIQSITYSIDGTLSKLLNRGTYYLEMKLFDEDQTFIETLIPQDECKINVR